VSLEVRWGGGVFYILAQVCAVGESITDLVDMGNSCGGETRMESCLASVFKLCYVHNRDGDLRAIEEGRFKGPVSYRSQGGELK